MGWLNMPDNTTTTMSRGSEARQAALDHLWMHNRSWATDAESGRPPIITHGNGVHVTDAEGREWMDVNGGYMCVNIGYGRRELADAMRDQMSRLVYFPRGRQRSL